MESGWRCASTIHPVANEWDESGPAVRPLGYHADTHSLRELCMGPLEPITRATMATWPIPLQRNEPNLHDSFTNSVDAQSQQCMIESPEQGLAERPIRQNEPNLHDSFTLGGQVSAPKPGRAHLGVEQTNPAQPADPRRNRFQLELQPQDRHTPCDPKTRCNPNDHQGTASACDSAKLANMACPGNDDSSGCVGRTGPDGPTLAGASGWYRTGCGARRARTGRPSLACRAGLGPGAERARTGRPSLARRAGLGPGARRAPRESVPFTNLGP